MKSSNSYFIIGVLAAQLAIMPGQAQTCIQGDCKGGEGVLRVDNHNTHTYYVGSFNRKSKLNGKGFEMRWDINDLSREVELLSALTGGIPSPDTLWHLKPFYIRSGEFKNGKLEGQGVFMVRNQNYFKDLLWAAKQWLPKAELTCFRYEGNFVNSEPQPSGVVYMIAPQDTIICASDQLWPPESAKRYSDIVLPNEMVIDVRRHTALNSELIRGNFLYYKLNEKEGHKLHGWAIVHRTNPFEPKGHFYRQLWSYGEKLYEDDGDAYPFDMADPKTLILEDGGKITGPVKDGKVNGFGTIEWGVSNKYTGYILNNRPHGYGQLDSGIERHGLFNNGKFTRGVRMNYFAHRFEVWNVLPETYRMGNAVYAIYENRSTYLHRGVPNMKLEGYQIEGVGWHGPVKRINMYEKAVDYYEYGVRVKSEAEINNYFTYQVYVRDGQASVMIGYDPITKTGTLADGRTISPQNKHLYKPSAKYLTCDQFFSTCGCGGNGKSSITAEIAGSTNSWTRTEQVNKSAVVGYWQGTQQVNSTYTTSGYTITRKVDCSNPKAVWIPWGAGGQRHVVLSKLSLPE